MGLLDESAIARMLAGVPPMQQTPDSGLLGGGPVAPAQMPAMAPPPPPPAPRLVDRLHERLSGLLDSVKSSAPGGYDGLLSPQEIQQAQPGRAASLVGRVLGLGTDLVNKSQYQGNLDHLVGMKALAGQFEEHKQKLALDQQHAAVREQVGSVLGDTTMTPEARYAALTKLMGVAYSVGDTNSLGAIANAMQSAKPPAAPLPKQYEPKAFTGKDGGIVWVKPGDPVPAGAKPFHEPASAPQPILIQGTGPDGQPTFGLVNKGTATATPITGMAPKVASAASSAQNAAAEGLFRSSVSEMGNADTYMREYEKDLASGAKSINGLSQFIGGIGNSFTHDDPASRAIQNVALTALNKVNPDLARYIRRGLSFAEGESGISKRPSDFRTKMAAFLSTASSGASPQMIADIQGRRESILNPLHDIVGKMTSPSKGSGSATGSTPSYDDWKKAHGH